MPSPTKEDIALLRDSGVFDAEWYRTAYPDVGALRMDPAEHYLRYGQPMGRVLADGEQVDISVVKKVQSLTAPAKGRALLEANEICRSGDDPLGLAYARKYLPQELAYTIETLRANAALRRKDEAGWLRHINAYLAHFDVAPVRLTAGDDLLSRLGCNHLTPMNGGPLVSIIMTAFNAENTVETAVLSLLQQTYRNIEIIIIDDKSDDATWNKLVRLALQDPRIQIHRNAINVGTYASKNIGLNFSKGHWITCLDADDWAHPLWLESHLSFIRKFPQIPRASNAMMLRITATGIIDRFAPIGMNSIDGVARDAPISCLFERDFLKKDLGGWDNVRYGADSEIIERAKIILGNEYKRVAVCAMLCLVSPGGLTSQPDHYLDPISGPSEKPRAYVKSYRLWHEHYRADPSKFPMLGSKMASSMRFFDAPPSFVVNAGDIKLNIDSILGSTAIREEKISLICVSKRPVFAQRVAAMLECQTHKNFDFIFVAHGNAFSGINLENIFESIASASVIRTDEATIFGEALNKGLSNCKTDLVAKIDDDDFYGPDYIRRSIAAFHNYADERVAIVGKGRAFIYASGINFFGIRFPKANENCIRKHVFGSTLLWSQKRTSFQKFRSIPSGVDSKFLEDVQSQGLLVYSTDRFDHIAFRHIDANHHTWQVSDEDFVKPATLLETPFDVALACSSFNRDSMRRLQACFKYTVD